MAFFAMSLILLGGWSLSCSVMLSNPMFAVLIEPRARQMFPKSDDPVRDLLRANSAFGLLAIVAGVWMQLPPL